MKAKMLKVAGVKSEKEFYKKFPTEEAFMKVHGKAFKKAQMGTNMQGIPSQYQITPYNPTANVLNNASYDPNTGMIGSVTGQVSQADTESLGYKPSKDGILKDLNNEKIESGLKMTSTLGQNYQKIKGAIQEKKQAKLLNALAPVVLEASGTRAEQTQRRYVRPEDNVNTGQEFFPVFGVGTNVLAKNGAEIANTFAPNTLYDDLGYEPLDDSERLKQFKGGGGLPLGLIQEGVNTVGDIAAGIISIGTNRLNKKNQQMLGQAAFQNNVQGMQQGQYQSYMKDGGEVGDEYKWISHEWQPQKIVKFGEHSLKDLLKPPADADMLRAGGHLKSYTPPSERAMSTERPMMEEGGELQTHWGGYAEPMSYNPYLPEDGETVMFRGQSHDESDGKGNTGIGITYGENPVEVERGEPAIKMKDGGNSSSLVVFGNLKIPHNLLGDPDAKGKNFKRYVSELSEKEKKQNKLMEKSLTQLDDLDVQSPFDRLKLNSLESNIMGANMKFKDIAQKKMDASALQTAMNDTIEEYGMETSDRGTIMARKGAKVGKTVEDVDPSKTEARKDIPKQKKSSIGYGGITKEQFEDLKYNNQWFDWKNFNPNKKSDVERFQKEFNKMSERIGSSSRLEPDGKLGQQTVSAVTKYPMEKIERKSIAPALKVPTKISTTAPKPTPPPAPPEKEKFDFMGAFNQILPFIRPSDAEALDPEQLMGEMFALSQNQLEPVQAQLYQPELSVPYDISLQDIMNENEATFRAQQRTMGYNPAAQSQLAAQKYAANQKVLGEQFRMNQAMKDQIYRENRNLLNDAKLKNLGILDQQYQRQAQAKSATKATAQEALNSIASKYAQNKLENRTLQVYENMYNYRFDPKFRAMNMNPLADFQAMIDNASPAQTTQKKVSRNGSIVKALKNI